MDANLGILERNRRRMGFDIYDAFQDEEQKRKMKLSLTIISAILLSSCVNIPIPPIGKDQGKLGSVQLKLAVSYIPLVKPQNKTETEKEDPSVIFAFEQFSKTIKDK
jgi:hypothetical protein